MRKIFIGFICVMFLSGCEAVNSGMSAVNDTLKAVNGTLSGSEVSGNAVSVPEAVKQATMSAFIESEEQQVQKMVNDAQPTIVEMVSRSACGADGSVMGRYTDPDSSTHMYVSPMVSMSYHKSGCVTPLRIQGWEKIAANALQFSVVYMSPQSEQTARRNYVAIKQPDGIWLFKWL